MPEIVSSSVSYNDELEGNVLGAILLRPSELKNIISKTNLKPTSFYSEKNRSVFKTILSLFDDGKSVDELIVASQLEGTVPQEYVSDLTANVQAVGNALAYAERLVELEQWRHRASALGEAREAVKAKDMEKFSSAVLKLESEETYGKTVTTSDELGREFMGFLKEGKTADFPLPYNKFNQRLAGGLRRKQMSLLGGWSSHGKSVVIDQWLEYFALQGHKCHLYINEMGKEDRVARSVARATSIPHAKMLQHQLTDDEKVQVESTIKGGCPYFDITECAGWSAEQLAYDIRTRSYDVIGIDILHLFDYSSEVELAAISRVLNRVTKQANCHIIATVHLNEFRATDVQRPRPILRDIRGSGMLKNDADNVMFIYREQDQSTGDPLPQASIYLSKVRNGQFGVVPLIFQGNTFSFREEREVMGDDETWKV